MVDREKAIANPEVIGSLALQISLSSRFDNQLLSAISFACAPISSNMSRQAANRSS